MSTKVDEAIAKLAEQMKAHSMIASAVLVLVLILLVWCLLGRGKCKKCGAAAEGWSGSMGPTVTNYNQSSDQVAVGDTAGTLNVNMTGADILGSSDFGCATRQPFGDADAWGWQTNVAAGKQGLMHMPWARQGAKPLVAEGLGQTVHHLQRGLSQGLGQTVHHLQRGLSQGARLVSRMGASPGITDADLSVISQGGSTSL
jgi:hypothetical protein